MYYRTRTYEKWGMNVTNRIVKTICGYCGTGCGLDLHVENNEITKVMGDKTAPVNRGQSCIKGSRAYTYVHSDDRLKTPLLRENGTLQPTSWKEALSFIAEKLKQTKANSGAESIAGFACARATNESNYIFQKMLRAAIGTNHIDGCNRT